MDDWTLWMFTLCGLKRSGFSRIKVSDEFKQRPSGQSSDEISIIEFLLSVNTTRLYRAQHKGNEFNDVVCRR